MSPPGRVVVLVRWLLGGEYARTRSRGSEHSGSCEVHVSADQTGINRDQSSWTGRANPAQYIRFANVLVVLACPDLYTSCLFNISLFFLPVLRLSAYGGKCLH